MGGEAAGTTVAVEGWEYPPLAFTGVEDEEEEGGFWVFEDLRMKDARLNMSGGRRGENREIDTAEGSGQCDPRQLPSVVDSFVDQAQIYSNIRYLPLTIQRCSKTYILLAPPSISFPNPTTVFFAHPLQSTPAIAVTGGNLKGVPSEAIGIWPFFSGYDKVNRLGRSTCRRNCKKAYVKVGLFGSVDHRAIGVR